MCEQRMAKANLGGGKLDLLDAGQVALLGALQLLFGLVECLLEDEEELQVGGWCDVRGTTILLLHSVGGDTQ